MRTEAPSLATIISAIVAAVLAVVALAIFTPVGPLVFEPVIAMVMAAGKWVVEMAISLFHLVF